jgi:hypothetical protein
MAIRLIRAATLTAFAAFMMTACGGDGPSVDARSSDTTLTTTLLRERSAGGVDWNAIPDSVSKLVGMSDAVVTLRVLGDEHLILQTKSDFSTFYQVAADVRIDETIKGELTPGTTIGLNRRVTGPTLEAALTASKCTQDATQALTPGSRYLVGLVFEKGTSTWFASAGPFSTVPFVESQKGAVVKATCPAIPGASCDAFPAALNGRTYAEIVAEARAAAR